MYHVIFWVSCRGDTYIIEVDNTAHVCKGVKEMRVNGNIIDGQVLQGAGDGSTYQVQVKMG